MSVTHTIAIGAGLKTANSGEPSGQFYNVAYKINHYLSPMRCKSRFTIKTDGFNLSVIITLAEQLWLLIRRIQLNGLRAKGRKIQMPSRTPPAKIPFLDLISMTADIMALSTRGDRDEI